MHQFASAVVSIFLSPCNWIIILLIAVYFIRTKSLKKTFIFLAVSLFIIFGNHWLLNLYARTWQPEPVAVNTLPVYSCGIVPGGFASPRENSDGYFNASADRFIQAVKLYRLGKIKHLLISGGNGKPGDKNFREAAWVKTQLVEFGVPDSVIFVEDVSDNTQDNAFNSKRILDSLHLRPPYLLISSAFHIPRASLIFKKGGLAVEPFPCNYTEGLDSFSLDDLLPRPSVLLGWDRYMKETLGYLWYRVK
ncbi:MAG: YdcF family protein [Ginsengibacter sp.]